MDPSNTNLPALPRRSRGSSGAAHLAVPPRHHSASPSNGSSPPSDLALPGQPAHTRGAYSPELAQMLDQELSIQKENEGTAAVIEAWLDDWTPGQSRNHSQHSGPRRQQGGSHLRDEVSTTLEPEEGDAESVDIGVESPSWRTESTTSFILRTGDEDAANASKVRGRSFEPSPRTTTGTAASPPGLSTTSSLAREQLTSILEFYDTQLNHPGRIWSLEIQQRMKEAASLEIQEHTSKASSPDIQERMKLKSSKIDKPTLRMPLGFPADAVSNTSDEALGSPVEPPKPRNPPQFDLATPTNNSAIWRYLNDDKEPGELSVAEAEARRHFKDFHSLRVTPTNYSEVVIIRTYCLQILEEARQRDLVESEIQLTAEAGGSIAVPEAQHTIGREENIVHSPPLSIHTPDLVESPSQIPSLASSLDLQTPLGSLHIRPDQMHPKAYKTYRVGPEGLKGQFKDCTHEQLAWIDLMCPESGSIRKLDQLTPTDIEVEFRKTFTCEIPPDWRTLAEHLAANECRKMAHQKRGMALWAWRRTDH